ncbi:MAG TPA: hypothetical protein DER56_07055 [Thermosipho africanus]|nr:hypothetical protein [Thermosipho africanus]
MSQLKQQERPPPIIIFERQSDENWLKYSLFCLIAPYLSEWDLSRVRSTMLALDEFHLDGYSPQSRMRLYVT